MKVLGRAKIGIGPVACASDWPVTWLVTMPVTWPVTMPVTWPVTWPVTMPVTWPVSYSYSRLHDSLAGQDQWLTHIRGKGQWTCDGV